MGKVFSAEDLAWADARGLPGARGFEFKPLSHPVLAFMYSLRGIARKAAIAAFLARRAGPEKVALGGARRPTPRFSLSAFCGVRFGL